MAKTKPKTATLSTCEVSSSVQLSIGDAQTDMATLNARIQIGSTLTENHRYSTGMQLSIVLPEGCVVADSGAATALARKEAAAILRKMAAQVAKG